MPIFSIKKLFQSIKFAFRGFVYVFKNEQNFKVQIVAAIIVIALMIYFKLPEWQVIILLILIGAVLILEMINTIFEKIADMMQPRIHHYVAIIKDLMAGAVLITSIGSLIIGIIIFWPYFYDLFVG